MQQNDIEFKCEVSDREDHKMKVIQKEEKEEGEVKKEEGGVEDEGHSPQEAKR